MAQLLKNLYNQEYITLLSDSIQSLYPDFDTLKFKNTVFNDTWIDKELKERMRHISTTLGLYLPNDYKKSIQILSQSFKKMNYSFGLENMIFQDFVEVYGLNEFHISMKALEVFTIKSSSEFAIRAFILKYQIETMLQMKKWAYADDEHLRRLATEGCRPRLPWAVSLPLFKKEPSLVIEILKILKHDSSKYVRKSVANNLNDISKDNPTIAKALAKKWFGESKECDSMIKHGCRSMLKNSDREVLTLFGFTKPLNILLNNFKYTQNVKMGEDLFFEFDLESINKLGLLRIEFIIHFLRKNGQLNKKVFKLTEADFKIKKKKFKKAYSFKKISTRAYYKGEHKLSIIINGILFQEVNFLVI